MKISDRLKTVATFIKDNANVADVGADHGLLEIYLLDKNKVNSIMAIENKDGPFQILRNNLKDYNVKLSLSDGLQDIDENVDTVVIAGMGGVLISDILKRDSKKLNKVKQIVVDAHRDIELVRKEVTKLGYYIEKEKIVFENKQYYFVISFLKGHKDYPLEVYEWGYKIKDDPLFKKYQQAELETLETNLTKYCQGKNVDQEVIEDKTDKIRRLANL